MNKKHYSIQFTIVTLVLFLFILTGCKSRVDSETIISKDVTQEGDKVESAKDITKETVITLAPTKSVTTKVTLTPISSTQSTPLPSQTVKQIPPITWYADLTQDGKDEKLVMDLTYVIHYPQTGEEKTIQIYSGSTGKLIWTGHADTVHPGWNGFYIYNDGTHDYLINWKPTMYQGGANYEFHIYSLTDDGNIKEIANQGCCFDMNRPREFDCDPKVIQSYVDMVNGYLDKSYVLVDTDNGNPVYSKEQSKKKHLFDVSAILDEIKDLRAAPAKFSTQSIAYRGEDMKSKVVGSMTVSDYWIPFSDNPNSYSYYDNYHIGFGAQCVDYQSYDAIIKLFRSNAGAGWKFKKFPKGFTSEKIKYDYAFYAEAGNDRIAEFIILDKERKHAGIIEFDYQNNADDIQDIKAQIVKIVNSFQFSKS